MVDIIIPAYNAKETIYQTLCSIAYQIINMDFNVYIINDCSNYDYQECINMFKNMFNIKEIKLNKNRGPGVARQIGIDNSNSEYIVFLDSDDIFYDCLSLDKLVNVISKTNSDVVIADFIEEVDNDYFPHKNDLIFLHGKIYRRKFLSDNNINFNDSRCNEDNGFNQLLFLNSPKIHYLEEFVHIWKNNRNSITRKNDHEYSYKGLSGYLYNITWALEKAIERNCDKNKIASLAYSALIASYFYYLNYYTYDNSIELLKNTKKIKKITEIYELDEIEKKEIFNSQYKALCGESNGNLIAEPIIKLSEYLNKIEEV